MYICYVSVLFGVDESASGGVKVESIFFQDSVRLSGLVVSVFFFPDVSKCDLNNVFFASLPDYLTLLQVSEFKKSLNTVNSACEEVCHY